MTRTKSFGLSVLISAIAITATQTAQATTYYSNYGTSRTHSITLTSSGTHSFQINGIASNKNTEWYVNGAYTGESQNDWSGIWAIDPQYTRSFSVGTTEIEGLIYDRYWNYSGEKHIWNVTVSIPKPDLIVQDISVSSPRIVGQSATITATLKNQGNGDASSFKLRYYVNGTYIGEDSLTFGLDAGNTNNESISYTASSSGTKTVRVVVDSSGVISESNEGNNTRDESFTWDNLPNGSFRGYIEPSDVRSEGAKWRLTSGPDTGWHDHGYTINNIPVGNYTMTFTSTPGAYIYTTPTNKSVSVSSGTVTTQTGTYVPTRGDLKVAVKNQNGSTISSGAEVVLYTSTWVHRDTKPAPTHWSLTPGNYRLEAYYNGEYWVNDSVTVFAGVTVNKSIQRNEPYAYDFKVYIASDNQDVTGSTVPVGTPLRYEVKVRNSSPVSRIVRIKLWVDRNKASSYDFNQISASQSVLSGGGTKTFTFSHTPNSAETYYRKLEVDTYVNSNYARTDSWSWGTAYACIVSPTIIKLTPPFSNATYSHSQQELSHIWGRRIGSTPSQASPESGIIEHKSIVGANIAGGTNWYVIDELGFPFSVPRSGRYKITFRGKVNGFIGAGRLSAIGHCAHLLTVGAGVYTKGVVQDTLRDTMDEDWPSGIKWFSTNAVKVILGAVFPEGWVHVAIEAVKVVQTIAEVKDQLESIALYSNTALGDNGLVKYAELQANHEYKMAFFVSSHNVGAVSVGILTSVIDVDAYLAEVLLEEQPLEAIGPVIQVTPEGIVDVGTTVVPESVTVQSAFVVKNIGDQVLTGQVSITPGPFEIVSGASYNLAPGDEFNMSVRFSPSDSGHFTNTVLFTGGQNAKRYVLGSAYEEGSLRVNIAPQEALADGAMWRVDGGIWRSSGYTENNLLVGAHIVEFKETISGCWTKPDNETAELSGGQVNIVEGGYTPCNAVTTPTISPDCVELTYAVTLHCATPGATIHYTTNNDDPDQQSTQYTGPFPLSGATTVRARAFKPGYPDSGVASQTLYPASCAVARAVGGAVYGDLDSPLTSGKTGVTITLTGACGTLSTTTSGPQGLWELFDVPECQYTVTVSKSGCSFDHIVNGQPAGDPPLTITVDSNHQQENQSIQFLADCGGGVPGDINGDGMVTIIGDVLPFVQCVYFANCPGDVRGRCDINGDGMVTIILDVPPFVQCVYVGNCPQ